MKTILDAQTRKELIGRINTLDKTAKGQWGKMTLFQMLKHCTLWDEWTLGTNSPVYRQDLLGKIFGKIALKSTVGNDNAMKKGMPAGFLAVKEGDGDIEQQKQLWVSRINQYETFDNPAFIHDFFGKMTNEHIGILAYKHADHHLRQFGS